MRNRTSGIDIGACTRGGRPALTRRAVIRHGDTLVVLANALEYFVHTLRAKRRLHQVRNRYSTDEGTQAGILSLGRVCTARSANAVDSQMMVR